MIANNWSMCPRCSDGNKAEVDRLVNEMKESYGKITVEEFGKLNDLYVAARDHLRNAKNISAEFREDWEIYGAEDGVIKIRYGGHCRECGLDVQIDIDRPFYPEPVEIIESMTADGTVLKFT